jgi:hypothetical protein
VTENDNTWPRAHAGKLLAGLLAFSTLAIAGAVVHDGVTVAKKAGGGDRTWYQTSLTGNHSLTSATAVDKQPVNGSDSVLKVNLRSSVPGAQVQIAVMTAGTDGVLDTIAGIQTATTAQGNLASGGYQPNTPLYFDVAGEAFYDVRCTAITGGGTADLRANTQGAASTAAE